VRQGQTTLVVLSGDVEADGAFVSIDGYTGEMVFEEGVGWVGFVPVTRLATPRLYHVVVDVFNEGAYSTTYVSELLVEGVAGEVEEIMLDPDNAALLAPELVAIDNETRFQQYTEPTGPRLWSGPWRLPVVGEHSGDFGVMRSYNGGPVRDWHHGHDISADTGTVIVAPARGRVVFATELPVHGSGVILDHGAGVYSGYWHMSEIQAEVGQVVDPGDPLGLVGTTGVTTGPHLHWEVIVQGTDVDPIQWTETTFSS
jgi:murein DD-endopeptidase MepM/ murein hydrolase activator NlpD